MKSCPKEVITSLNLAECEQDKGSIWASRDTPNSASSMVRTHEYLGWAQSHQH